MKGQSIILEEGRQEKREALLNLKSSPRFLKGVGPERCKLLSQLGLETIEDIFYFFPRRYEDRRTLKTVSEAVPGEKEAILGTIASRGLIRTRHGQSIFRVVLSDGKANLFASWFNQPYLTNVFQAKKQAALYGRVDREGRFLQLIHPEYEIVPDAAVSGDEPSLVHFGRIVPVYPLTEDLSQKGIRHIVYRLVQEWNSLNADVLPAPLRKKIGLTGSADAFRGIHFPSSPEDLAAAHRRLIFDEFFLMQLAVQIRKAALKKKNKELTHAGDEGEVDRLIESFEFDLTEGQRTAIREILADMKKDVPMNRLVQGDVGSGKTAVAAAALVFSASSGFQAALMAPTEVLARQHFFKLTQVLEPLGISCVYLGQGLSAPEKKDVLRRIEEGSAQVVIGTHALIQENVRFKKLGVAVIDEQHKFGVFQRSLLKEKGKGSVHLLLMTATPIPRTLAMTLYGDLDVSTMRELPKGRRPIQTLWVGEDRRAEIYRFVDDALEKGNQAYVVCPFIEATSEAAVKSAVAHHAELSALFAHRKIGLLHGRMKTDQKKKIMGDFREKKIEVLVSTVVIEVGVDVPNASVMIIESAEKFGLAQLHQLRGRVGRGAADSYCFLFSASASEETLERLGAFEETESGFDIAEKDLGLRGAGDVVGEKQHGLPQLRIGDFTRDIDLLYKAKKEAENILSQDAALSRPEYRALKKAVFARFGFDGKKPVLTA